MYDDIKPIMETMHREVGAIVFQNLRVSTNPPRCTFIVADRLCPKNPVCPKSGGLRGDYGQSPVWAWTNRARSGGLISFNGWVSGTWRTLLIRSPRLPVPVLSREFLDR